MRCIISIENLKVMEDMVDSFGLLAYKQNIAPPNGGFVSYRNHSHFNFMLTITIYVFIGKVV